ncbi:MAG: hypothetical protein Q6373_018515 [Candidatus Sigynarchaeota archaeon]
MHVPNYDPCTTSQQLVQGVWTGHLQANCHDPNAIGTCPRDCDCPSPEN